MTSAVAANPGASSLATPLITLVVIIAGFVVMLRTLRRRHPTRARAMNFRVRSMTGANAALVLGAVSAAKLLFDLGRLPGGLAVAVVGGIVVVIGLSVMPSLFEALIGLGGLAAFLVFTGIEDGVEQATWYLTVAVTMLVALGITRGLAPIRR